MRISLKLLLLVIVPISALVALMIRSNIDYAPIEWKTYSESILKSSLQGEKPVFLLVKPKSASCEVLNNNSIRRSFIEGNFEAILLEYDSWNDPIAAAAYAKFANTKYPYFVFFKNHQAEPVVMTAYDPRTVLKQLPPLPPPSSNKEFVFVALIILLVLLVCANIFKQNSLRLVDR